MSAAPVTLQDLLFLNGKSLVSNCGKNLVSSKPGVAGLVGLGKVTEVGENVQHIKVSDSVIVSQTGTWTKKGVFRSARVRRAPSVSPENVGAFCLGLSAWGMLSSGALKSGDSVVHNLTAGQPLVSAVSAVAKELGGMCTLHLPLCICIQRIQQLIDLSHTHFPFLSFACHSLHFYSFLFFYLMYFFV